MGLALQIFFNLAFKLFNSAFVFVNFAVNSWTVPSIEFGVAVTVTVGAGDGFAVTVTVGAGDGVAVTVTIGAGAGVAVTVTVGAGLGVAVTVTVGVGVGTAFGLGVNSKGSEIGAGS